MGSKLWKLAQQERKLQKPTVARNYDERSYLFFSFAHIVIMHSAILKRISQVVAVLPQ
jgi:hypothetical protein